ncbi:MAG: hypothetical protein ACLUI7_03165 [Coprococcus sp.]
MWTARYSAEACLRTEIRFSGLYELFPWKIDGRIIRTLIDKRIPSVADG